MQDLPRPKSRFDRILIITVFAYQAIAVLAFMAMAFLAVGYFNTPFLGAFFDSTMIDNGVSPVPVPLHGDLTRQGVGFGDQLIALDGKPVQNARQIQAVL